MAEEPATIKSFLGVFSPVTGLGKLPPTKYGGLGALKNTYSLSYLKKPQCLGHYAQYTGPLTEILMMREQTPMETQSREETLLFSFKIGPGSIGHQIQT